MPALRSFRVPALVCVLSLGGLGSSCALFQGSLSKPPTIEFRAWRIERVLVESGKEVLGTPSMFVDEAGQPMVALANRSPYVGMQSIAMGRRTPQGWAVEFPVTPSAWRVCGAANPGGGARLTYGDLEGPVTAVSWDGVVAAETEPGPCPKQAETMREATGTGGTHQIERSRDTRTLWHRGPNQTSCGPHDAESGLNFGIFALRLSSDGAPHVAVFEHPQLEPDKPGRVRHVECKEGAWVSSVVATDVVVRSIDLAVDAQGQPHVAYVVDDANGQRLVYAAPQDVGQPLPEPAPDPRVVPAVEACLRARQLPPSGASIEIYQKGDPFRCAILARDDTTTGDALAEVTIRCDSKDAAACAVAGSLNHWLMGDVSIMLDISQGKGSRFVTEWRGLRPQGLGENVTEAADLYGLACEYGDTLSCLHAATLLPPEDERRLPWATTACRDGLAHGCALVAALATKKPPRALAEKIARELTRACDSKDLAACDSLGVVMHRRGNAEGARTALGRACDGGVEVACSNLKAL